MLDSISQEPIPFVHIYDGNKGVISSSLGAFYWQSNAADSISFSCMGYGTKKHIDAIHKHGVTQFHRKSFEPIKSYLKK